jgi:hypothetical protein
MAEHQLPKLTVRVRFSSPAPHELPDHGLPRPAWLVVLLATVGRRAISVPLVGRVCSARVSLSLGVRIDRARDRGVCAACLVLVDDCSSLAIVAHPRHQVTESGTAGRRPSITALGFLLGDQRAANADLSPMMSQHAQIWELVHASRYTDLAPALAVLIPGLKLRPGSPETTRPGGRHVRCSPTRTRRPPR